MNTDNLQGDATAIHIRSGEQANIIIPPGCPHNQITIINHQQSEILEPAKPPPETVAEMLEDSSSLEVSARLKFIRKVYMIVGVMMWITIGFCFLSYFSKGFFEFQINNFWCFYMFLGIAFVLTIVVMCCGSACIGSQGTAVKAVLLLIIVLCFSYVVSFCTSIYAKAYGAPLVVEAAVLTGGLVFALTLYAFVIKTNFTTCMGIIVVVFFCFLLFGISFAFTMSGALHTLYATFGCIFSGIILVLDTQWIADGSRGCSLDDPLLGALIIYIDILRVFLYVLQAMGSSK